jgi:two-component system, chemotaxis family, chemotaxis protein CheY
MSKPSSMSSDDNTNKYVFKYIYRNENSMKNEAAVPRIMIVDDMPDVRSTLKRILTHEGYNIAGEAEDGGEAVVMAKELKPDLIIMDYMMHEMNGIEATKILKAENPYIKVIIYTGEPAPSLVAECIKAGASNFIPKPVDRNHLLLLVKNLCA